MQSTPVGLEAEGFDTERDLPVGWGRKEPR